MNSEKVVAIILAIFLPPLAVFMKVGLGGQFWLNYITIVLLHAMIDMSDSGNNTRGVTTTKMDIPPAVGSSDLQACVSSVRDNSSLAGKEQDIPTELPPFSFRKKPIMYTSIHSNSGSSIIFKDFDYDEQIRAPRMANSTTAAAIVKRSDDEQDSTHEASPLNTHMLPLPSSKDPPAKYHPAIFDLTKPTRRFSVPEVPEGDDFILNYTTNNYIYNKENTTTYFSNLGDGRIRNQPSLNNLTSNTNEPSTVISNDKLKCMYELKKPMCVPAVLRPNTATSNGNFHSHLMAPNNNESGLGLEHASSSSSPLEFTLNSSVMAVKNDNSPTGSLNTSLVSGLLIHPMSSRFPVSPELEAVRTNSTSMSLITGTTSGIFEGCNTLDKVVSHDPELTSDSNWRKDSSLQLFSGEDMKEPTHIHWKPQNEFCMKCFESFGLLRRRRRHHCRFCGLLICSYCLQESKVETNTNINFVAYGSQGRDVKNRPRTNESYRSGKEGDNIAPKGILLDGNARFVIPINNAFDVFSHFKASKVCKNCGELYGKLLTDVRGQRLPFNFVFIENPYVKKRLAGGPNPMLSKGERGQSVVVLTGGNGTGIGSTNISSDFLTPITSID
ncbi:uncharacterized protein KQ657_000194 [Scheffersomyces spartinae]|uniref:FYVE-type domain-containing protein n=1 Tax=Scheffersomyces spartinae TaxID=45513 RepID=A0A9P7VEG9_9ASCO|nr:uncharacterized protein KQ657_000194 [Scheffersomyces spartinae]KAG7196182.1 hypothetical protein KQ657_000194 [Scheffersomyces spartinae]